MRVLRENCVVLDTSIVPKRPGISDIETLITKELQLDMSVITSIQPHNVKNVVYLGTRDKQAAANIASAHHMKHSLVCEGKRYPLPMYVETSAVDVRIYDLPPDMDNELIIAHMREYGEVISIQNEVWKRYFPGLINGVRILRMKLKRPIPSYITVNDEMTLVSYKGQTRTCRHCDGPLHPKRHCSEAAPKPKLPTTSSTTNPQQHKHTDSNESSNSVETITDSNNKQETNRFNQHVDAEQDWPSLPTPVAHTPTQKKTTKRQKSNDSDSTATESKKINATTTTSFSSESNQRTLIPVSGGLYIYRGITIGQYHPPSAAPADAGAEEVPSWDGETRLKSLVEEMDRVDEMRAEEEKRNT